MPSYLALAIIFYSFYLLIGIVNFHDNPFIDIKFQLFSLIFFFLLINFKFDILKVLFSINTLVFIIYGLLFLDILPNIWHESTLGVGGRINGPSIIVINLILFYYLITEKPFDNRLIIASLMGFICIALTTNFMNLAVFAILIFLQVINFRKLLKPIYIITFVLIFLGAIWYLNSPYVPELVSAKMKYIYKPWEYGSLKTRIEDFNKAILSENFNIFKKIFGEGYGASTSIYRENKIAPSLSRTFNFQEIDNGFYYLYHRGGWSLLFIFILSHLYLLLKLKGAKAKLGFISLIFVTNILSIHYFNYYFYLLIPFFILYRGRILDMYKEYNP
tara:strand:- start:869 stop:1861 length:993 start_codon:yes stop_codon:yes gene_type:complete